MYYSLIRRASLAPNQAALNQCIGKIARGRLMQCHLYRQAVDRELLAASLMRNLRQCP
jgi:hypothetical protein